MAAAAPAAQSDKTFRNYKPSQALQYASLRPAYPRELYDHILGLHESTGGQFGYIVDVGCGPGLATRDLAPAFEHALGVDPGAEMINVAREKSANVKTKGGEAVRFEFGEAERLSEVQGVNFGEVDLITSATAAHWFDMKKFWQQAAKLLRPGGTVAIWTRGVPYAHPDMPYGAEIEAIQAEFQRTIDPYLAPGNRIGDTLYDDLELPWAADPSQTAFPQSQYQRFDWDRGGKLSDGKDFLGGTPEYPVEVYGKVLGTVSAVTRWREAHPELAGTEKDVVNVSVAKMKKVVGDQPMKGGSPLALLFFKKAE